MATDKDKLIVALPSKGRIMDDSFQVFAKGGLVVKRTGHERGYRGIIENMEGVEIAFLSSSEIAYELGRAAEVRHGEHGLGGGRRSAATLVIGLDLGAFDALGLATTRARGERGHEQTRLQRNDETRQHDLLR